MEAVNNMGLVADLEGDASEARKWYRRALNLDPSNQTVKSNLDRVMSGRTLRDELHL